MAAAIAEAIGKRKQRTSRDGGASASSATPTLSAAGAAASPPPPPPPRLRRRGRRPPRRSRCRFGRSLVAPERSSRRRAQGVQGHDDRGGGGAQAGPGRADAARAHPLRRDHIRAPPADEEHVGGPQLRAARRGVLPVRQVDAAPSGLEGEFEGEGEERRHARQCVRPRRPPVVRAPPDRPRRPPPVLRLGLWRLGGAEDVEERDLLAGGGDARATVGSERRSTAAPTTPSGSPPPCRPRCSR